MVHTVGIIGYGGMAGHHHQYLADYVKFENDSISRDFTFTLAEENVLPDGLKLSYARISGYSEKSRNIYGCI